MDSSAIVSTPVFYGKRAWPGCPSKKQDWGYLESLIHYIAKYPSSAKVYQKMIQSCKYFFEKNPVLVASQLQAHEENVKCDICLNEADECNKGKCCVKNDIAKASSKIWLCDELGISDDAENFIPVLCSKLYRCEINHLKIWNKVIMFDDFQIFTSSAKEIMLSKNSVTYNDGKPVMLDKILECFHSVTEFDFTFDDYDVSMVNVSTMKNIMKLKNLGKMEGFGLYNLPESLSIEDISAFFKKFEHVNIVLRFNKNISVDYKNHLDALIDEIIESGAPNRYIGYDGQDEEKSEIMTNRWYVQ
uniref:Uncharacterized protein n=1 Tax=Panagrolaimus davidi TaxID=227884 RepID=A0A914P346_9BILA